MQSNKSILLILLLFFFSLNQVAAEIKVISPEPMSSGKYHASGNLVFISCGNGLSVQHNIQICGEEQVGIPIYPWENSCFISSIQILDPECNLMYLSVLDDEGNILDSKTVVLDDSSRYPEIVSSQQGWKGDWNSDPETTAHHIWLLSGLGSQYVDEIENGMEWLKLTRHPTEKCWPAEGCSIEQTAKTLAYLVHSKQNDSRRVIHDAQAWLNSQQNIPGESPWSVKITSDYDTNCTLSVDDTQSFDVEKKKTLSIDFIPKTGDYVNISCEDRVGIFLYDDLDNLIVSHPATRDFEYTLPEECWSQTKWSDCDPAITLYSLLTDLPSENFKKGKNYIDTKLLEDETIGEYLDTINPLTHSALYLQYIESDENIIDWLIYEQKNQGYWGIESNILQTLQVYEALSNTEFDAKSEVLNDAYSWIEKKRPFGGWGDPIIDDLTYLILGTDNDLPIESSPMILILNDSSEISFTLRNPSSHDYYDLRLNASEEIKGMLDQNFSFNLSSGISESLSIPLLERRDGSYYGTLDIIESTLVGQEVLLKIPVIIINPSYVSVDYPASVKVFGDLKNVSFVVNRSSSEYECMINDTTGFFEDSWKKVPRLGTQTYLLDLEYTSRDTFDIVGEIECISSINKISIPLFFEVDQYPGPPFTSWLDMNKTFSRHDLNILEIANNLDEDLTVTVLVDDVLFFAEPDYFSISPRETAQIPINSYVPFGQNYSGNFSVHVESLGYTSTHDVEVIYDDLEKERLGLGLFWFVFPAFLIPIIGALAYRFSKGKISMIPKKSSIVSSKSAKDTINIADTNKSLETPPVVENVSPKTSSTATKNEGLEDMIEVICLLSKTMNKNNEDIRNMLVNQGFDNKLIDTALKEG